ncbi:hypothetical protein TURU_091430 [Turdus rufiventris]|nr:hypothetical protein TURU_091430 [Turdus rufiventris]
MPSKATIFGNFCTGEAPGTRSRCPCPFAHKKLKEKLERKEPFAVSGNDFSSVRSRYPFKEDLVKSPGKWTTADEGIQCLRELAVLEVFYSDLKNDSVSKDPEDVPCTLTMWRKVVQGAPASYSSSLVALYYLQMDTPTIEVASSWL